MARGGRFAPGGGIATKAKGAQRGKLSMTSGQPYPNTPCGLGYEADINGGCIHIDDLA
jgi:hypothetical protein